MKPDRPAIGNGPGQRPTPPRLTEVAREAGVSPATISRALNTPELLSRETLARVQEAIARTGYVPNLLAGGLASRRSRLVAFILPSVALSLFNETLQTMTEQLAASAYQAILGLGGLAMNQVDQLVDQVLSRRPDGLILTGSKLRPATRLRLIASGIPIIETWEIPEEPLDMVVGFSHGEIGRRVALFALERGYRSPLLISSDGPRALSRSQAFRATWLAAGRDEATELIYEFPTTFRHGIRGLSECLAAGGRPDLVVCSSDWAAHGVLIEAEARGLHVPDDLAVIGFGDLHFAADVGPGLTTVAIDGVEIGRLAAECLLKRARGEPVAESIIDVGSTLVFRGTT